MKKVIKILSFLFAAVFICAGLLWVDYANAADVTVVDVTDYGANGSDTKSDRAAIQACLNMAKDGKTIKVVIPAGKYYIDDTLMAYANTTISLNANAEIIRMDDTKLMLSNYRDQVTGGYGQASNIVIEGGKWNGNVKHTTNLSPLMLFYHAQNITIKNTDIGSYCAKHAVIFGGIKKGTVENVKFHDFVAYTGTDPNGEYYTSDDKFESLSSMEALHLDCIAKDGNSEAGAFPLDGTPCADITVSGCEFVNVPVALGNHYEGYVGTGLTVKNNKFSNLKYVCINAYSYRNAAISGNTATNVGGFVKFIDTTGSVTSNNITCKSSTDTLYGIYLYSNSNVAIDSNTIKSSNQDAIALDNSKSSSISNNKIYSPQNHAIALYGNKTSVTKVNGNTIENGKLGILLSYSSADLISGNTISKTSDHAISLINNATAKIDKNQITSPGKNGISVNTASATISGNTIKEVPNVGIGLYSAKNSEVSSNTITNPKSHGIELNNATSCKVNSNTVSSAKGQGIGIYSSKTITASGNTVTNAAKNGIYIDASSVTVQNNKISDASAYGISAQNASTGTISGNTITKPVSNGISLNNSPMTVSSNTVSNAGNAGVMVYNTKGNGSNLTVSSNKITAPKGIGIQVNESSNAKITGNEVTGSGNHGIQAYKSSGITINKNIVKNSPNHGITVNYSTNVTVTYNTVSGSGSRDICANNDSTGSASNNAITKADKEYTYNASKFPMSKNGYEYWIVYNANGGSGSMGTTTVMYGVNTATAANAFTKSGYSFKGWTAYRASDKKWYCGSDGWRTAAEISSKGYKKYVYGNKASVAKTTAVNGDTVTFYAEWGTTYTIKYNANGGSGSMANQTITYGVSTATRANTFTRSGYSFTGWTAYRASDKKWYCGSDGWRTAAEISSKGYKKYIYGNKASVAKSTTVNGDTVTFYAEWKKTTTYTIKYNANGGSGSMANQTITYGVNTATRANTFTRSGYSFTGWTAYRASDKKWYCGSDGWRTAAEISSKGYKKYVYGNKASIAKTTSVNGDTVTFYAEWKKGTFYTIKYNANGGSGSMADQTITYGVSTATRANTFTRSGYTFKGWTAYRASDKKWYCGNDGWRTAAEISSKGYKKYVYGNKTTVSKTTAVNGDTVTFYAEWGK